MAGRVRCGRPGAAEPLTYSFQSVADWRRANPKNRRGENAYALEDYGLDEGVLVELFGDYMRRFDIPREQVGLSR